MKILIVGNGGREHAIAWKVHIDDPDAEIYCAPGNAGTAKIAANLDIKADEIAKIANWAEKNRPDLTIVGPETPLCLGIVDELEKLSLQVFGPSKNAAKMEGSKNFAKEVMCAAHVPTAISYIARTEEEIRKAVSSIGIPAVLKADGLAAGKGVFVCMTEKDVDSAIYTMLVEKSFGDASSEILVEEFLEGEEISMLAFVDGNTIIPLASAQDHKRLLNNDQGPNTGGMGSYSPAPVIIDNLANIVHTQILKPVIEELKSRNITYKGILYAGLMITKEGPKVLEFNCRFGDPETQSLMPRLKTPIVPIMKACIDGTLDSQNIEWHPNPCVCVVMASGGYPDKYEKGIKIQGLENVENIPDVHIFHAGTKLADGNIVTDGGRVLGVTAVGATIEKAVFSAYQSVLKIKFEDVQYRTDIAARAINRKN